MPVTASTFANSDHQAFVVVVVLGVNTCDLGRITCSCSPDGIAPYNLVAWMYSTTACLMDMDGETVHSWEIPNRIWFSPCLLENGNLIVMYPPEQPEEGAGEAQGIQELDWNGDLVWSIDLLAAGIHPHHDFAPMPNGNLLCIAWDMLSKDEALQLGRNVALTSDDGLWIDSVIEIKPTGQNLFDVVWQWHLYDHLIQEIDPLVSNYGSIAEHPELLNVNYGKLAVPDYTHANAVDYNEALDQVIISVRNTNEFLIIDHSTTTAEAAGHTGGRCGRGGDILYRWGNPAIYNAGTAEDALLFGQHDARWIPQGYPGAGNVLVFNNGVDRAGESYSSICEIVPPLNPDGTYLLAAGQQFPAAPVWEYVAQPPTDLYSGIMSGAQRLPGGNTQAYSTEQRRLFEVTPAGEIVWEKLVQPESSGISMVFRVDRYWLFRPWLAAGL